MAKKDRSFRDAGRRLDRVLELPAGTLGGGARIELHANREATIDGCRGVLDYSDETVRFNVSDGSVAFYGRDLMLKTLTDREAVLAGYIQRIEFNS